jgi:hypothetical protein
MAVRASLEVERAMAAARISKWGIEWSVWFGFDGVSAIIGYPRAMNPSGVAHT